MDGLYKHIGKLLLTYNLKSVMTDLESDKHAVRWFCQQLHRCYVVETVLILEDKMRPSKQQQKRERVKEAVAKAEREFVDGLFDQSPASDKGTCELDWARLIPPVLDPATAAPRRGEKKRQQLQSLLFLFHQAIQSLPYTNENDTTTVVELGSGSGQLGLLLAYLYPHIQFVLIELSDAKLCVSQQRAETAKLENVHHLYGSAADMLQRVQQLDLLIGLHCCGSLTDYLLAHAASRGAAFVCAPCCYGQACDPPAITDPRAKADSTPCAKCVQTLPRSCRVAQVFSNEEFQWIARAADVSQGCPCGVHHHKEASAKPRQKAGNWIGEYTTDARHLVNFDRAMHVREAASVDFSVSLTQLYPPGCTAMREVIIGSPCTSA